MRKFLTLSILLALISVPTFGQIYIPIPIGGIGKAVMPEHGFLPGHLNFIQLLTNSILVG